MVSLVLILLLPFMAAAAPNNQKMVHLPDVSGNRNYVQIDYRGNFGALAAGEQDLQRVQGWTDFQNQVRAAHPNPFNVVSTTIRNVMDFPNPPAGHRGEIRDNDNVTVTVGQGEGQVTLDAAQSMFDVAQGRDRIRDGTVLNVAIHATLLPPNANGRDNGGHRHLTLTVMRVP